ncbi:lipid II:glycine glycyltransferase FemX [Saccharicrinis sp. FJH54]|uniref:lipid II:glycine glycyltransferase FemX n=1 Tax=Saccharicrinis sp. FJH54 TaxID=3344665 RepID=UPI0035D4C9AF
MYCGIQTKKIEEIGTSNIVQQTSFWADVKYRQGFKPYAFKYSATRDILHPGSDNRKKVQDDILVLIKYINREQCIAYIPYGPKDEPDFENHGVFLEELSEALRAYLPKNCIVIRYDLPWENQWAEDNDNFDRNGEWLGPPSFRNQEFRINYNTNNWNLVKSYSDMLPSNTIFLNLKKSADDLMQNMKSKTRYNIRLSQRKGVEVRSYGLEKLDSWYELYKETAIRNHITIHNRDYFYSVLRSRNLSADPNVEPRLIMADYNGEFLAAMFLILSRKRGTYLYGASSGKCRNLMASYAVQWEAIRLAQEAGCTEYDMFGVAPNRYTAHPLHGLYRFKSGFGGYMYHRMGCWDYPLNQKEYITFRAQELNYPTYHNN